MAMPSDHLYALIDGYIAGILNEDQELKLVEQLRVCEAARQLYLEYMELNQALQCTAQTNNETLLQNLAKVDEFPGIPIASQFSDFANSSPIVPVKTDSFNSPPSALRSNSTLFTFLAITGSVVMIALVALIVFKFGANPNGVENGKPNNDAVVKQTKTPNSISTPDAPAAQVLQLNSGTAKLDLQGIGMIVAEGPTDFKVIGPNRARLNYGNIKVLSTKVMDRGFTIETPHGEVIDWGKEMGLSVRKGQRSKLIVLDGDVEVRLANGNMKNGITSERLTQGDGVLFGNGDSLDRISAIYRNGIETFELCNEVSETPGRSLPIITNVSDNRDHQVKKFYEIVRNGLREDAPAFVDRVHQWNGVTSEGIPKYLLKADYVKTFNSDRNPTTRKNISIQVTLAHPAKLYLFIDDRIVPTEWLTKNFRNTGDKIGLDEGPVTPNSRNHLARGPTKSVDTVFSIWERIINEPGIIELGPNPKPMPGEKVAMYGIAAVPLEPVGKQSKLQQ
jgi:hypothetical protein